MAELARGVTATKEIVVEKDNCTERGDYQIFSTPELVLLIELTAIQALAPHLTTERSSVGSRVDIAHSAPTLLGQNVWSTATVKEVDRRRILFDITVRDDVDTIATGTHERFIVDLDKFSVRLADKARAVAAIAT